MDARQILARKLAFHVVVGAHAEEYRVKLTEQILESLVLTDTGIENELDTHAFEYFTALFNDALFQFERWNAVGQQATDVRIGVKYDWPDSVSCQHISRGKSCRTRANDCNALAGIDDIRHIRTPALRNRFVGNIFFDAADTYRTVRVMQGAGSLA